MASSLPTSSDALNMFSALSLENNDNHQNEEGTPSSQDQTKRNGHSKFEYDPSDEGKSLIVNYLPTSMTDRGLYSLFVPYGALHSVQIMKTPKVSL